MAPIQLFLLLLIRTKLINVKFQERNMDDSYRLLNGKCFEKSQRVNKNIVIQTKAIIKLFLPKVLSTLLLLQMNLSHWMSVTRKRKKKDILAKTRSEIIGVMVRNSKFLQVIQQNKKKSRKVLQKQFIPI